MLIVQYSKETCLQAPRPYERQKAADERTLLFAPPEVRTQQPQKPRPLPAAEPPSY